MSLSFPLRVALFSAGLSFCLFTVHGQVPESLPVKVAPDNAAVHYVGRWDKTSLAAPRCDWADSEVDLHFTGTALNVGIDNANSNQFEVVVDGQPASVIKFTRGQAIYPAASGLANGEHTVQIVKRTESSQGAATFTGFEISAGGAALAWTAQPAHRIELIGDSITCGYGNEAASKAQHYTPSTQDAYMTFGPIAARMFNAECTMIAWSGRKLYPNNTMPSIYPQTLGTSRTPEWDFTQWTPDVVVISLATNDFGGHMDLPDPKAWMAAYEEFITGTILKNYPKAAVFIATSPLLYGAAPARLKAYLTTVQSDLQAKGATKVYVLDIPPQDARDGYGADWHPSVATHKKMAAVLASALEDKLGWKAVAGEN